MFVLLPVIILIVLSVVILGIQWKRPSYGYPWLTAVVTSLIVWGLFLSFRWWHPIPFEIRSWDIFSADQSTIIFLVDEINWPIAFSLVSLLLFVVLTDSTRLMTEGVAWIWAVYLGLIGAGLLAVLSGSIVTQLLTWTLLDLFEFIMFQKYASDPKAIKIGMGSLGARVSGTLVIIMAMSVSHSQATATGQLISAISPSAGVYYLIGAGLRLGVLPLNLTSLGFTGQKRGFGTILSIVPPISGIAFLGRLPVDMGTLLGSSSFSIVMTLIILYASYMWLQARNDLEGRPYWMLSFSGMAVLSVLNGVPSASIIWGVALALSGSLIFQYSIRTSQLSFIPVIGALGFSGLPFTPAAAGWFGLAKSFDPIGIAMVLAQLMLLLGYLRHGFQKGELFVGLERWVLVLYPTSLMGMIIIQWFVGLSRLENLSSGVIWASIVSTMGAGILYFWFNLKYGAYRKLFPKLDIWTSKTIKIQKKLTLILQMNWMNRFIEISFSVFGRIVRGVSGILEGDGGVLWALLMLVLLSTVVQSASLP